MREDARNRVILLKGVSAAVSMIGGLIIFVIVLIFATKSTGNVFDDKRGETELTAMGIRNTIVLVSLTDNGKAIYSLSGKGEYSVNIDNTKIKVQYLGQTLPTLRPEITIRHYTPRVKPAALAGSEFCIVSRKDTGAGCGQVVEVCLQGDACCSSAFQKTVC